MKILIDGRSSRQKRMEEDRINVECKRLLLSLSMCDALKTPRAIYCNSDLFYFFRNYYDSAY